VPRYLTLFRQLLVTSAQVALQYRLDFVLGAGMAFFWVGWNVSPLLLVFHHRENVGGWTLPEALLVISFFLVLKAMLEGAVSPNLVAVVEHIRKGTLDFILVKPVDAQFMVSASRFAFHKVIDAGAGVALAFWASARLGLHPGFVEIGGAVAMLAASTAILYSLWLVVISLAFWFVRVDNLSYLFTAIFDAARWPVSVFRGWVRVLLTFVIPVGLMTTFPAMALLGTLSGQNVLVALALALAFLAGSRFIWTRAVRHYASASS
jgi:ABC-2 type transport system permease protein